MQEFVKRIAKLIDVKSIISIATTFVFCYLALRRYLSAEVFISVYSIPLLFIISKNLFIFLSFLKDTDHLLYVSFSY